MNIKSKTLVCVIVWWSIIVFGGMFLVKSYSSPTPTPTATATPFKTATPLPKMTEEQFVAYARQKFREAKEKAELENPVVKHATPPQQQFARQDCDDTGCPEDRARAAYEKKRLEQRMSRPPGTKWRNFSADDEHGYPNN